MTVSIEPAGDASCILKERTVSCSVDFPLPISKPALLILLKTLLNDPDAREVTSGPILIDRLRDGPRVHLGSANFAIRYADACPLILE